MRKPRVITRCVANQYAAEGERIIEFAGKEQGHGGLISFRYNARGVLVVSVYRRGTKTRVTFAPAEDH